MWLWLERARLIRPKAIDSATSCFHAARVDVGDRDHGGRGSHSPSRDEAATAIGKARQFVHDTDRNDAAKEQKEQIAA